MSPADAFDFFLPRYEAFEAETKKALEEQREHSEHVTAEMNEVKQIVAVMAKENELTRKSIDRFTNALIGGSVSIVFAAVAVIVFGATP